MKIILCLALGLVVLSGGAWLWRAKTSESRQQTAAEIQRDMNVQKLREKFREHIDSAKAEGRREIVRMIEGLPSNVTSVEQVIHDHSLVRVKVHDKENTVSDSDGSLQTWYKLKVSEVLVQQKVIGNTPLPDSVPSRFLPLHASESLLVTNEGSVTVDGIVIKTLNQDPIFLVPGREYLIAADLDSEGKFITPIAMVDGIFRVEDTKLKPLGLKNRRLVVEVEQIYNNNLGSLRSDIYSRQVREK